MLEKLFRAWKISHLVFEKDSDAYARDRDEKIIGMAREMGVKVISRVGRTLYDPDELVKANGGKPTMSITQVQNVRNPSETQKGLARKLLNVFRRARNCQLSHDRYQRLRVFLTPETSPLSSIRHDLLKIPTSTDPNAQARKTLMPTLPARKETSPYP